jgi:ABC-type amino acid transport substrate-binding protein
MYLEEAPETSDDDLGPLHVGVLGETTSETEARRILENLERTHDNFGLPPSRQVKLGTVKSHYEGFLQLRAGQIKAYLADREILLALQQKTIAEVRQAHKNMTAAMPAQKAMAGEKKAPKSVADAQPGEKNTTGAQPARLVVSEDYYSVEPYAIGIHIGNVELRYVANSVLSELYNWDLLGNQQEHIFTVLSRNFPRKRFSKTLESLFRLQRIGQGQPIRKPDDDAPCP